MAEILRFSEQAVELSTKELQIPKVRRAPGQSVGLEHEDPHIIKWPASWLCQNQESALTDMASECNSLL